MKSSIPEWSQAYPAGIRQAQRDPAPGGVKGRPTRRPADSGNQSEAL